MRILYNFENKILIKDNLLKSDICSKVWYRYNIYDRSRNTTALLPSGKSEQLDVSGNLFDKSSIDVVSDIRYDNVGELVYTVEPVKIINLDKCECDKTCVYVTLYNVFGLDCISSSEFELENGGVEKFDLYVYSLMQYTNLRVRCSVVFVDADHALVWKKSIGAFRKVYVYFDGKEMEGYIDFSTIVFNDSDSSCNFDVVAKLL